VRPGYTLVSLRDTLGPHFRIDRAITYSRFGSELVDTALNGVYELMRKRSEPGGSSKGTVVTQDAIRRHRKQFRMLSALYPILWLTAAADVLLPWQPGHKLIVRATRV
jgi:hypothetical protein